MDVGVPRDLGLGEDQRVGIGDMEVGMDHHHGALGRNLVEVAPVHAPAAEIDRIEAPSEQRDVLAQRLLMRRQGRHHFPRCSSAP